jgi:hypothetical protein
MLQLRLHIPSVLTGALAAAALASLLGMARVDEERLRIQGIPTVSDFVTIQHKEKFVVPEDKVLVIRGIIQFDGLGANNEITVGKEAVFKAPGGGSIGVPGPGILVEEGEKVAIKHRGTYITGFLQDA